MGGAAVSADRPAAGALGETVLLSSSEMPAGLVMATLELALITQSEGSADADGTLSNVGPHQTRGPDTPSPDTPSPKPIAATRKTIAEPARAIDNLPPAAVTEATGAGDGEGGVELAWAPSADDRPVGFVGYRGFAIPIPGVESYEVWRGEDEASLRRVAILPSGSTSYEDGDLQGSAERLVYRVDALDLDNRAEGTVFPVSVGPEARPDWRDPDGNPVYILDPTDSTPTKVDFSDFVALAMAFGAREGGETYSALADTNDDGVVNFTDFVEFAKSFGRTAETVNGQPIASAKPPGEGARRAGG